MNAQGVPEGTQCEAMTGDGDRCHYLARTRHYVEGHEGRSIMLCHRHDEMLDNRAEAQSESDVLAEWGYAQPPQPDNMVDAGAQLDAASSAAQAEAQPEANRVDPRPEPPAEG